ncbi:hypothetical protein AGLY_017548 [Aphis glycines]|uniref:Uncharacterized protein n=1 Tax=Aphis glycines TaxID=307491 RepID=A0A6G0SUW9_APHGL|nr:hypothetical protein AGLY_017548 [Aphis glycines]
MQSGQSSELAVYTMRRGQLKAQLTKFQTYINNVDVENNIMQIRIRLEKIKELWTEFDIVQNKIEALDTSNEQLDHRDTFVDSYFDIVAKAETMVQSSNLTSFLLYIGLYEHPINLHHPYRLTSVSGNFPDKVESSVTHLLSFQITAVTASPSTSAKHSEENPLGFVFKYFSSGKMRPGTLFLRNVPKLKPQELEWCRIIRANLTTIFADAPKLDGLVCLFCLRGCSGEVNASEFIKGRTVERKRRKHVLIRKNEHFEISTYAVLEQCLYVETVFQGGPMLRLKTYPSKKQVHLLVVFYFIWFKWKQPLLEINSRLYSKKCVVWALNYKSNYKIESVTIFLQQKV